MIDENADPGPWWKRLLWLVLIWAASVTAIGLIAWMIRLWIR